MHLKISFTLINGHCDVLLINIICNQDIPFVPSGYQTALLVSFGHQIKMGFGNN